MRDYFKSDACERPGKRALKKGEARLPKANVVNVSQILTVDKEGLVDPIGKSSAAAAESVREGLHVRAVMNHGCSV